MSRRSKLVYLFSFNAILASAVVAMSTVLFAGGGSAQRVLSCGASESSQESVPVSETFASITEAEAFICYDVPYPRSTPGWQTENISATRTGYAVVSFASITLDYLRPDAPAADLRIEVSPFPIDAIAYGVLDQVRIMGAEANLIGGLDEHHFILQWEAHGFSFYAEAYTTDSFGLPQLYDVLNSIE